MIFQAFVYLLAIVLGFVAGVFGTIAGFFVASGLNKDPTVGGAYVAMAMILSPFVGIASSIVFCVVAGYFLNK